MKKSKLKLPKMNKKTVLKPKVVIDSKKISPSSRSRGRVETVSIKRQSKPKRRKFAKVLGYSALVAVLTIACLAASFALQFRFGKEVIVNGKSVGIISDNEKFDVILKDVKNLAQAATNGGEPELEVELVPMIIKEEDVTPEFTLRQNMLASCQEMVEAYAVYINEALICATTLEADAFAALNEVLNKYNQGSLEDFEFLDTVAVRKEFVPATQLLDTAGIVAALNGQAQHREIYTVLQEEDLYNIAERFGMKLADLQEMNKGLTAVVEPGVKVNVMKTQPVIRVQTKNVEKYNKEITYEVENVDDNTLPKGSKIVASKGQPGLAQVEALVIRVNGEERERVQRSENIITQPKTEKVRIGTKTGEAPLVVADTGWLRPASGPITSLPGARWGSTHDGVDIGATYGAAVRASVGGKVTLADWNGAYGMCIRINSGEGLIEIYGHLSEILVSEGQTVQQGDLIGKVGNTGRSTGPHLHFEVRKDNVPINPMQFINK